MESLYQRNRILLQIGEITTFPLETCYSNNFWIGKSEKEQLFATSEMRSEPQIWGRATSKMRGKVIRFDKKVIKSEQICSNMIKKRAATIQRRQQLLPPVTPPGTNRRSISKAMDARQRTAYASSDRWRPFFPRYWESPPSDYADMPKAPVIS